MSEKSQRELGDSDSPFEDELEDAFARMLDEGSQRQSQPLADDLSGQVQNCQVVV
jgi:hypothetical protein